MNAQQILDRYFLEMRCKVLDVAAALDRVERSEGAADATRDPRLRKLLDAIRVLESPGADRTARIQMILSDAYADTWERPTKHA